MPRTKLRKVATNKRARDNNSEIEDILRDFDVECENALQKGRSIHKATLELVDVAFGKLKKDLGPDILKMTMGELRKYDAAAANAHNKTINDLNMTVKKNMRKADEGYITEEAGQKTSDSEYSSNENHKNAKVSSIGPLKSLKSHRRSKSASNIATFHATPGPRTMMTQMKMKTPVPVSHASRSKYRTPLQPPSSHQRAVSADRVDAIIPKANRMTPLSILRHPRSGEIAFSVSGSPIVVSNIVEKTANVNIPVPDGILSVRPESIDPSVLDSSIVKKIDTHTINHLRTLKQNLDLLMKAFEKQ